MHNEIRYCKGNIQIKFEDGVLSDSLMVDRIGDKYGLLTV